MHRRRLHTFLFLVFAGLSGLFPAAAGIAGGNGATHSDPPDILEANGLRGSVMQTQDLYGTPHHLVARENLLVLPGPPPQDNEAPLLLLSMFLVSIAVSRYFSPGWITKVWKASWSRFAFYSIQKEGGALHEMPGFLLQFNFLIVVSLLAKQSLRYTGAHMPWEGAHFLFGFMVLFLLFVLFYILKKAALVFLAWVFSTATATRLYYENILVVNQFSGLLLAPLVFFHAFNPAPHLLYAAWILAAVVALAKVLRGILLGHRASGFSVYYLFLYLCSVEIIPLLLIAKTATGYFF